MDSALPLSVADPLQEGQCALPSEYLWPHSTLHTLPALPVQACPGLVSKQCIHRLPTPPPSQTDLNPGSVSRTFCSIQRDFSGPQQGLVCLLLSPPKILYGAGELGEAGIRCGGNLSRFPFFLSLSQPLHLKTAFYK